MRIVVVAKAPELGRVKTRLAATLGPQRALAFAEAFLDDTLRLVEGHGEVVLASTRLGVRPGVETWLQGEGDLGERLGRLAERAVPAVFLGSDSPGLPEDRLQAALRAVSSGRAAVAPAEDGGFVLLGLPHVPRGLFAGVRWSTEFAGGDMITALHRCNMPPCLLESWWDVDVMTDLARLARDVPAHRIPSTSRLLLQAAGSPTR